MSLMQKENIEIFYPPNLAAWRTWLENNHKNQQSVWLVFYRKSTGKPSITWSESVDMALCFGWIDSKQIKIDDERSHQFFSKRKAKSTWSKINKLKIEQLIATGQMTDEGYKSIEIAKQNGSWTILDEVEELIIPEDLSAAWAHNPTAQNFYDQLSKSTKKGILQWLVMAKRAETRQNRIKEIVTCASQQQKPKFLQ